MRLEERVLFPFIEQDVDEERLAALRLPGADGARRGAATVADLHAEEGRGVAWTARSDDLNVNVVVWPPGAGVDPHVNSERDLLWIVLEGGGVRGDGRAHQVSAGWGRSSPRAVSARRARGPDGLRYASVHLRRPPGIVPGRPRSGEAAA